MNNILKNRIGMSKRLLCHSRECCGIVYVRRAQPNTVSIDIGTSGKEIIYMVVRVVGVQNLDFVNSAGEHVQGTNLFASYPDDKVVGEKAEKFFVKPEVAFPEQMKIGEQVNLSFNNKGKVEQITRK